MIDIPDYLRQERARSWHERSARDREIALKFDSGVSKDRDRVIAWWQTIPKQADAPSNGRKLEKLFRRLSWLMFIAGTLLGLGAASAALFYNGAQPINVLLALALLVLLPFSLLCLSFSLPFVRSTSLFGETNVGHIALAFLMRRQGIVNGEFGEFGHFHARDRLLRWRVMLASQQFGLAFALAALTLLLAKTSFSDLAFVWSSSLNIEANAFGQFCRALSWPWSSLIPQAVPSETLIEQSRYFRLHSDASVLGAAALTQWWPFLAMSLIFYGVTARGMALVIARLGLQRAIEFYLMSHSEVASLCDRLNEPVILSAATEVESVPNEIVTVPNPYPGGAAELVFIWNDAIDMAGSDISKPVLKLGGDNAPADDRSIIGSVTTDAAAVRVVTKAWEPPMLEFHDLIIALREHFGARTSIVVQPVNEQAESAAAAELDIWRASLARLQDPKLYVR